MVWNAGSKKDGIETEFEELKTFSKPRALVVESMASTERFNSSATCREMRSCDTFP